MLPLQPVEDHPERAEDPVGVLTPTISIDAQDGSPIGNPVAVTDGSIPKTVIPTWAPGGQYLAFAGEHQGHWGIFVQQDGQPAVLASRADQDVYAPAWAPNGHEIAVQTDGRVAILRTDDGAQRPIPGALGLAPAWSSDGQALAFVSVRNCPLVGPDYGNLFIVELDGRLTQLTFDCLTYDWRPAWLPSAGTAGISGPEWFGALAPPTAPTLSPSGIPISLPAPPTTEAPPTPRPPTTATAPPPSTAPAVAAPTPAPVRPPAAPTAALTVAPSGVPAGATAICNDGTYSFSQTRQGTCSHHRGVWQWLP